MSESSMKNTQYRLRNEHGRVIARTYSPSVMVDLARSQHRGANPYAVHVLIGSSALHFDCRRFIEWLAKRTDYLIADELPPLDEEDPKPEQQNLF